MRLAAQFVATHPTEANILNSAANSALANLPAPGNDQLTYGQARSGSFDVARTGRSQFDNSRRTSLRAACARHESRWLCEEVLWTDQTRKDPRDYWRELTHGSPQDSPRRRLSPLLRGATKSSSAHRKPRLCRGRRHRLCITRRSLEALCIALSTTDRLRFAAPSPLVQKRRTA